MSDVSAETKKSPVSKVVDTINKDVQNENETKTNAVISRVLAIMMCIYSLAHMTFSAIIGQKLFCVATIVCFAAFLGIFLLSYANKTKMVMLLMNSAILIATVAQVYLSGLETLALNLIVVSLVYFLTTSHWKIVPKVLFSVALFAYRALLYTAIMLVGPMFTLTPSQITVYTLINNAVLYIAIIAILLIFAQAVLQAEDKLIRTNEKIKHMAEIDPLTKLKNRRAIMEYLEKLDKEAHRGKRFCIAIGDIDHFKHVNDTYGHEAGDEVLKMASNLFSEKMGGFGQVARWGGEEFLFILEDVDLSEAREKLNQLRMALARTDVDHKGTVINVSMTFGLSEFRANASLDEIINEADKKLYAGKEAGRNRVVVSL